MIFKVKPQVHLLTFYTLLPNISLVIVLLFFSHFGLSDTFKYAAFFFIALSSFCLAIIALVKGLLSELEFKDGKIIYITDLGGLTAVDLRNLNAFRSIITAKTISLTDEHGNTANIDLKIYSSTDAQQILNYIYRYQPMMFGD